MKANSLFLPPALLLAAVSTGLCQPVITTPPSSLTNIAGTTATFSVAATGTEPLHYQWQFNTFERTNQTNAIFVLTNVQTGNAGSYTVVITNVNGAATSAVATLTVLIPPKIRSLSLSGKAATSQDISHLYLSNSASPGANLIFTTSVAGATTITMVILISLWRRRPGICYTATTGTGPSPGSPLAAWSQMSPFRGEAPGWTMTTMDSSTCS